MKYELEIDRYISGQHLEFGQKQPILSASVDVDKMLLYSSYMQTTCIRKHNEQCQDNYLAAMLAGVFS